MKKLSLVMSIVLVLTALVGLFAVPTSAATYAEDTVAVVNGVEVTEDTILEVLLSCPTGGTVEIVKDFTTFSLLFANNDGKTCEWTINGNGHTITSPLTDIATTNYLIVTEANRVTINNLTLKTWGSGILIKDGGQVFLNDVNVYSGGTKEGTNVEASDRAAYTATKGGPAVCSYAVRLSATTRSTCYIDGGVYKAYGVNGMVLAVERGNMVVYDGYIVGEDCSFVVRVLNASLVTDLNNVTASVSIYGGTFIKPVANKHAGQNNEGADTPNTNTDGAVVRGDAGGLVNIYGGTFASFADTATLADGTAFGSQRDSVILGGISGSKPGCVGYINIFGGDFYSLMGSTLSDGASQLFANYEGTIETAGHNAAQVKINTAIYGGNFYTNKVTRETNFNSVIAKDTNNNAASIQHVPADQFSVATASNQSATVYGKSFTGLTKWTVNYSQPASAPADASVKVTHPNNKVYYISDYTYTGVVRDANVTINIPAFAQAINAVAKDGSTVTLLKDISLGTTEILNRGLKVTIDGNNKTLTFATNGLSVSSGDITIKNLSIVAGTGEGNYAFRIAKNTVDEENTIMDSFELKLKLENCSFTGAVAVVDNPFLIGTVETTGCMANGQTLNISHTYAAPEAQAPLGFEEEEPPVEEEPTEEAPKDEKPADAPATDAPADDAKKGCGGAIGVGAVAILAVAGVACTFAKKRED